MFLQRVTMKTSFRNYIFFYLNGQPIKAFKREAFLSVSDFLRQELNQPGTKVVCAEGDCGACTALLAQPMSWPILNQSNEHLFSKRFAKFKTINTCIHFVYQLDGCHLVTVEGLSYSDRLHTAQQSLVDNFGSQCGYCTPGFVASMVYLSDQSKLNQKVIDEKMSKNFLTGNLCRCTGYQSILKSCTSMKPNFETLTEDRFLKQDELNQLSEITKIPVEIFHENQHLFLPVTIEQALEFKTVNPNSKVVAGNTDLGVLINKNKWTVSTLISLMNIKNLYAIEDNKDFFYIGSRVNLSVIEESAKNIFPELSRILNVFASPQIKHAATLVGNVLNASPISDTTPFLMVADAELEIIGPNGLRFLNINDLYLGYKKLNISESEIVTAIRIPKTESKFYLLKSSVRKDLDIAIVNLAVKYHLKKEINTNHSIIESIELAIGGVGPTVMRLKSIEDFLKNKPFELDSFQQASQLLEKCIQPISDVRATAEYRRLVSKNLLIKIFIDKKEE